MSPKLKPYQQEGVDFLLAHPRGMERDEMRLGKTPTAITAAVEAGSRRTLVLAPAIGRPYWREKIAEWAGNAPTAWEVESYDRFTVNRDRRAVLYDWRPDTVLLDEAHYLKTRDSARTLAVYGDATDSALAGLDSVERVWPMSGTIAPNHVGELYPHFRALFGETRTYWGWLNHYAVTRHTDYGIQVVRNRPEHIAELRARLRAVSIRRTQKEVWGHAARLLWNVVPLEGGTREIDALEKLVNPANPNAPESASLRRLTGEAKVKLAVQHIEGLLESGATKIAVFAYHRDVIAELKVLLKKFHPVVITGGMTDERKVFEANVFNTLPHVRVVIGQVIAAGTVISLKAADMVVFVESSWVPGENKQAAMRAQDHERNLPLPIDVLVLLGHLDEAIARVNTRKDEMSEELEDAD